MKPRLAILKKKPKGYVSPLAAAADRISAKLKESGSIEVEESPSARSRVSFVTAKRTVKETNPDE